MVNKSVKCDILTLLDEAGCQHLGTYMDNIRTRLSVLQGEKRYEIYIQNIPIVLTVRGHVRHVNLFVTAIEKIVINA